MLNNEILHRVNRPARYTGGEWNAVVKDWDKTTVKMALAYPDTYEIGMSNMAVPILYDILNRRPDALAERVYAPWVDMEAEMRERRIPLFSLETRHALKDFDIVGFSLGYELTYTNVLNMLDLAGIPVLAAERDGSCPLVVAGGSCCLNPEPMSDFIDVFVIGDGEEVIQEFIDACIENKGAGRKALLKRLAQVEGVYVPSLYQAEYDGNGFYKSLTPTVPEAKASHQEAAGRQAAAAAHPARRPLHRGRPRPRRHRGAARVQPRLPLLPGGHDLPAGARAPPRRGHRGRRRAYHQLRLRRGLAGLPEHHRLSRRRRAGHEARAALSQPGYLAAEPALGQLLRQAGGHRCRRAAGPA